MPEKIFVYHDGALGDVLLSLPAMNAMKGQGGSLHFAGRPDVAALLTSSGIADDVSDAGGMRFLPLHADGDDEELAAFLSSFTAAWVFTVAEEPGLSRKIRGAIPNTRVIQTVPPQGCGVHVAAYRLGQLGLAPGEMMLNVPGDFRSRAERALRSLGVGTGKPLLTIHPGSGSPKKNWPIERYCTLSERLRDEIGCSVALFSGPAEDDASVGTLDRFSAGRDGIVRVKDADLPLVAGMLSLAAIHIGNDSGISHLASAAGTPVIALFGPTDPVLWAPQGRSVEVIASDVPCSPCGTGHRQCEERGCLSGISVDDVCRAACALFSRGSEEAG